VLYSPIVQTMPRIQLKTKMVDVQIVCRVGNGTATALFDVNVGVKLLVGTLSVVYDLVGPPMLAGGAVDATEPLFSTVPAPI